MNSPKAQSTNGSALFDAKLADLPTEVRWREWMGRVEAAIFASSEPVPRDALAKLVGRDCVLDDLISDIRDELKGRPYELAFVGGGFHHRTKARFAEAIRSAAKIPDEAKAPDLTRLEALTLAGIAYRQPITRAALSEALGRDVSRDVLARLKRIGLIGGGPRAPFPGAPLTYVTTPQFLSVFGMATLRDLPEIEEIDSSSTSATMRYDPITLIDSAAADGETEGPEPEEPLLDA